LPHLLIDRFRFDSFAQDPDEEDGSRLLTRFGADVFMFFMITPPEATVERAWKRGEQFGRYKAVDDLLAHNVEAYTGIPGLFFTWALRADKRLFFEFLDNSVAEGQRPRTIAFGSNGQMNILDLNWDGWSWSWRDRAGRERPDSIASLLSSIDVSVAEPDARIVSLRPTRRGSSSVRGVRSS
jgi:hypothetical protein